MPPKNPFVVFDGHNDSLLAYFHPTRKTDKSFFVRNDEHHIDLPRAREGGFGGGFFAVFVPPKSGRGIKKDKPSDYMTEQGYFEPLPKALTQNYALPIAMSVSAGLFKWEAESKGQLKVVKTAADIEKCFEKDVIAAVLHFEGAEAIDPDLTALEIFYRAGLRSLGPVWSRPNVFAEGVPFQMPQSPDTGPGLTDAGVALVKACNQMGILIDLSHLNEKGFWDVAKLSDAPLVATHSNVHAISPWTRNLTDRQLDAIKETDGMVGLNFAAGFLRPDGKDEVDTPLDIMVEHIDYLVERLGIDRVGLGSDFDGATMFNDMKDVSKLPNLIAALRKGGYDDGSLRKITHENWLRVLKKTWKS
jgi:membrane dipeptidase